MDLTGILLLSIGLGLGALLGTLWARTQHATRLGALEAERRAALDRVTFAEQTQARLSEQFRALSSDALARSNVQFLELADTRMKAAETPIRDALERLDSRLREIEQARAAAHAALATQIDGVRTTGDQLRRETASLVTALRKPQVRGRWGEMHLRKVVEVAGMVDRCDFTTQTSVAGEDGLLRPDMIVYLAGGKQVAVDSKVPLTAFLDAAETDDEDIRRNRLGDHARLVRTHVEQLGAKAYWQRLSPSPEFVVLFVPGEAFLAQALETDPALLEHAAGRKVVIATPTTLIALLRTVAYAWSQESLAQGAREVFDLGRELYDRLGTLGEHVDKLGRALTGAVGAYNRTVGSLEGRVLVSARRLRDLKVVEAELGVPQQVEDIPRALSSPELVASAEQAHQLKALNFRQAVRRANDIGAGHGSEAVSWDQGPRPASADDPLAGAEEPTPSQALG